MAVVCRKSQRALANGNGVRHGKRSHRGDANDTLVVTARRTEQGFFSKVFGVDNVNVHATAKAVAESMSEAKYVVPFVVDQPPFALAMICSAMLFGTAS